MRIQSEVGDSQKFKAEYFNINFVPRSELIAVAIALDPAISPKAGADFASIIVAGIGQKGLSLS